MNPLDDPAEAERLKSLIRNKPFLRRFYAEVYGRYAECLARSGVGGIAVEMGSGLGFVKDVIPGMMTTDVLPYPNLDGVMDATRMPFSDGSVAFIGMLDVFHHIPDVEAFLSEAQRCLRPGGRLLIIDQHPGWIGRPILRYLHHEPFRPDAKDWNFTSTGPLSSANGALAWIVFRRDLSRFQSRFPRLSLRSYRPHTPLRYWLSGGLKKWSLLPGWTFLPASWMDRILLSLSPNFGSFVDIEIEKVGSDGAP